MWTDNAAADKCNQPSLWIGFYLRQNDHKYVIIQPKEGWSKGGVLCWEDTSRMTSEELTLFVADGNRHEGDEGHDRQQREENADEEEELEALEPGPPEVLQVHDVSDEGPERQHPWGTEGSEGHVTLWRMLLVFFTQLIIIISLDDIAKS